MKSKLIVAASVAALLGHVRAEAAPKSKLAQTEEPAPPPQPPATQPAPQETAQPETPPPPPPREPVERKHEEDKKAEGGEALAVTAPPGAPPVEKLEVRPYILVSGGAKVDFVKNPPSEDKENRASTFALSRIGLKANWGDWISAESEIMANGGVSLHGTSAYEGQAALQVRQQVVRLGRKMWRVEVGRVFDEASIDFFSAHVAETFLQDTATRDPLLFTGFNLGNGVRGTVEVTPGLRLGLNFNAGNPVSTTSSLMIGGAYPPFERFYTQPYQSIAQAPNNFPDDTFHIMVLTPSVLWDSPLFDIHAALQMFDVDTNMNGGGNDHIRGYNARGTARLKLLDGVLVPFLSGAYTRNDTLVPTDLSRRSPDRYQAVNVGGGIDIDWARRFKCPYDCADGIGLQYQQVQFQIGEGLVTTNRYANIGATVWIAPDLSLGARLAAWQTELEKSAVTGERSAILALRFIMQ